MPRITIVTAGTRGDIQPYVALGEALRDAGFSVRVVTPPDFQPMVEAAGLAFASIGMAIQPLVESPEGRARFRDMGKRPSALIRTILQAFREHAEQILDSILRGCRDADAVVFSSLGFPAYHVAEARRIPAIAAYLQPLTPTRSFPAPVGPFPRWLRWGWAHRATYTFAQLLSWWTVRTPSNAFRQRLGLSPLGWRGPFPRIQRGEVPHLYAFSSHLVPPPPDWPSWARITGYWFRSPPPYTPPEDLRRFLEGPRPVIAIGFGSMRLPEPETTRRAILQTLASLNLRAVIIQGWSGMTPIPHPRVYWAQEIPHEWLFPRVDAVVHHGGAGTTAMGLRYGRPTLIVPFLADQFFWGERVTAQGVGYTLRHARSLHTREFPRTLQKLLHDTGIRERARHLARAIQAENGLARAVEAIRTWVLPGSSP